MNDLDQTAEEMRKAGVQDSSAVATLVIIWFSLFFLAAFGVIVWLLYQGLK